MMRTRTTGRIVLGDPGHSVTAVIFGLDVIVDDAGASAAAWKTVLDAFLRSYSRVHELGFTPFDLHSDYLRYMHGRSRSAGACAFLAARGITLPYDGLRGLATSHEEFFLGEVRRYGVVPFPDAVEFTRELRRHDVRTAAVSLYLDGGEMLRRAGAADLFDVIMDGLDAPGVVLPEHPDPHLYLQAAARLHASPGWTAVVEESAAGVAAARAGGFGTVIGVDRTGEPLGGHGASLVVGNLSALRPRSPSVA